MAESITEVWYACYGSNIREMRFLCYINGGTPPGASFNFVGCADKSGPKQSKPITIDYQMYFAKHSPTWNGGGICFLNPEKDTSAQTLGRTYLINTGQFTDLVRQELKFEGEIKIDFEELKDKGHYNCMSDGRYGLLLQLGEIGGVPVITFTSEIFLEDEINKPDDTYLITIIKGLKEIYNLEEREVVEYLFDKQGIKGLITKNKLYNLMQNID